MNTNYKEIRAVYNDKTIRVYQAFNAQVADEAVAKGTFGSHFSMNRMSWIKPSFRLGEKRESGACSGDRH